MQLAPRLAPLLAVVAAGLVGCGESSDGSTTAEEGPTTIAALGDSITAGSPLWDPSPTIRRLLWVVDPRSLADAAADLEAMVERGEELGLDTALAEVLPWNGGSPRVASEIRRLNERIAAIGARQDAPVLPFYGTLEDPQNPGRINPRWTIDGDHPSVTGYRRLGRLIELPLDKSG